MNNKLCFLIVLFYFLGLSYCNTIRHGPINILEEKCLNATGDPEFFGRAMESVHNTSKCLDSHINRTSFITEINELVPLGRVHEVLNRACSKQDAVMECFSGEATTLINTCLNEEELNEKKSQLKIVKLAMRYVCQDNADILSQFITKSGPSCIEENKLKMTECVTTLMRSTKNNSDSSIMLTINCGFVNNLQKCIVPELQKCEQQAAANLGKGLLNVAVNALGCSPSEINLITTETNNEI